MKMIMTSTAVNMIDQFNSENMRILQELGVEVQVATNFDEGSTTSDERTAEFKKELTARGIKYHNMHFSRKPLKLSTHIREYKRFLQILRDEDIDFIHCHSPICSVLTRLAARKKGAKAIYTAHGFHFYDGAPKKNWILFYPIEKYMSRFTDTLILLNEEDYKRASERFHAKKTIHINGVGIDLNKYKASDEVPAEEIAAKRAELGLSDDDIMILTVGELIPRKDQMTIIRALAEVNDPHLKLFICGIGHMKEELLAEASRLGIADRVQLLGYRSDIAELNRAADGFIFSSIHEGMPVALMEAVASKTPVICSKIRGNVDLVKDSSHLYPTGDFSALAKLIKAHFSDKTRTEIANAEDPVIEENHTRLQSYSKEVINEKMREIYKQLITDIA